MFASDHKAQSKAIQYGALIFWMLFWLFNVIDKFVTGPRFLWVGTDRFGEFNELLESIGIMEPSVAFVLMILVGALEITAFVFVLRALIYQLRGKTEEAAKSFFWGIYAGLVLFSFFAVGDQVFGEREELLEHTMYWIALIISWGAYRCYPTMKIQT